MAVKMIDIVKLLQSYGHNVQYRVRKDGGILITSIDGGKYTAAKGNETARNMAGVSLSPKRATQLQSIRPKRLPALDPNLKKEIVKTQRIWNKLKKAGQQKGVAPEVYGKISTKKFREREEELGTAETIKSLQELQRYAKGLAYSKNIDALLQRIDQMLPHLDEDERINFEEVYDLIDMNRETFREEWISPIYNIIYDFDNNKITSLTALNRIRATMKL